MPFSARAALGRGDTATAAQQLDLAEGAARDGLAEARALMEALAPLPLQGAALAGAVERVAKEIGSRLGFATSFEMYGEARSLSRNTEVLLLRAAQVALVNVGRHSGARDAKVRLFFGDGDATLTVEDNGGGFDPALASGFGLSQLRARAGELGGEVEVVSAPGEGTVVRVWVPTGTDAGLSAVPPAGPPVPSALPVPPVPSIPLHAEAGPLPSLSARPPAASFPLHAEAGPLPSLSARPPAASFPPHEEARTLSSPPAGSFPSPPAWLNGGPSKVPVA